MIVEESIKDRDKEKVRVMIMAIRLGAALCCGAGPC
jgi:hypothetical protein